MSDTPHVSPFEGIRKIAEDGSEYWSARDLYKLLGYSTWQKFQYAIEQAKIACEKSGQVVSDHFNLEVKMIQATKGVILNSCLQHTIWLPRKKTDASNTEAPVY